MRSDSENNFRRACAQGFRAGAGMPSIMVIASMAGFGSLARDVELGLGNAIGSTVGIWGLPGQMAMTELFALGAPVVAVVTASSMANLRFMPMAVSLLPLFRHDRTAWRWRYALAQIMSVNIWAVFLRHGPDLRAEDRLAFYLGLSAVCLVAGVIGSVSGYIAAGQMPTYVAVALIFLNPVYFAFVFCSVRQRNCIIAVVIGALLGPPVHDWSPDWGVPMVGFLAGTLAFALDHWVRKRAPDDE